ncbi:G-D-S-L family lipolytic protein [Flavivirga abyssicola]|uniref:G-D-S-L family lipolytic protein n=1 Tax=Flavivirga abyssicola TaxID=3063533 RepID=UPI0026E013ED|nr:G-D-S-L family lipolytic protein [Flavivirga sp. MEBiC07777]WVK14584.1 G-D-S-L family lipolytic protein [Flavivirga sp. MEBiC07777]
MNIRYIYLFVLALGFFACDEDDNILPEEVILPELTTGSADFSNYVAVGASFTSGFTDGGLFKASQENSFPNILSKEFAKAGGGDFTQPLMSDNTGGILVGGNVIRGYRLTFNSAIPGPQPLDAFLTGLGAPVPPITTEAGVSIGSDFKNFGIPGAKSWHLVAPGYAGLNPYYARIASAPMATVLADAMAQNPTFFTLSEVGGNDVLGYATSGGDGSNLITPSAGSAGVGFDETFNTLVTTLTSGGAKGVVTNVPYVTDLPHFTTVPNNALVIDEATAGQLTGFFQAVAGIFTQVLIGQMVPPAQAQALASQYAIPFSAGANRWIIDVPVTPTNPLGFRQMTEDELLVLTIDQSALAQGYGSVALTPEVLQVLGILQTGGTPTPQQGALVIAAVNGIDDGDALDSDELAEIKAATDAYNITIAEIANSNDNIALVDLNSILNELASTGIDFDGFNLNADLVTGGAVGLDGIHLTARGYAYLANKFLEAIDSAFGSNFIESGNIAKANDYPTNYSPTLQ